MNNTETGDKFAKLVQTIKALRTPETGCPWDLEQDHRSLRPYLLEEAYEVLQAIDQANDELLCDELGDLLLQVVLHAQVATDRGSFTIDQIVSAIDEKMIRRHPHVFGDRTVSSSAEVLKNWEASKLLEKTSIASELNQTLTDKLRDIPQSLPALIRAQRIGEKASRYNFDWENISGVIDKVKEELAELENELKLLPEVSVDKNAPNRSVDLISQSLRTRIQDEFGDLLFSLCQLSRWLGFHAEDTLRETSERFLQRFSLMEKAVGSDLNSLSLDQLEQAWQAAKANLTLSQGEKDPESA